MGSLAFVNTIGGIIHGSTLAVFVELAVLNLFTYLKAVDKFDQTLVLLVVVVNVATLITLDWFRNGTEQYETA